MPIRNEARGIEEALESVFSQDLDVPFEVVVAEGRSTDGTREVLSAIASREPRLRVVDNPKRGIAAGLNAGLAAARGRFLVRMDGHARMLPGYVGILVDHLRTGNAEVAGGRIDAVGKGAFGRAVAAAHGSRFAIGNAAHHYRTEPALIDHVSFGAYRTELAREIGGWDESFARNEDYEFNRRIRLAGGRILIDPHARGEWDVRETPLALARQYFSYGFWKVRSLARHPGSLRLRWLAPPLLVLGLIALGALAPTVGVWPLAILSAAYVTFLLVGAGALARSLGIRSIPFTFVALATIHLAWGAGFVAGTFAHPARRLRH
jgi:glycosyltransferase involved in cell wall biosynthesis